MEGPSNNEYAVISKKAGILAAPKAPDGKVTLKTRREVRNKWQISIAAAQLTIDNVMACALSAHKKVVVFTLFGDVGEYVMAVYAYFSECCRSGGSSWKPGPPLLAFKARARAISRQRQGNI